MACEIRNTHINIGTGKEISIKNLAELVKEKVGFKGKLYFNTEKPDGTLRKLTDVTKLHNLGWHHKIEIEEGVEKMGGVCELIIPCHSGGSEATRNPLRKHLPLQPSLSF